MLDLREKLRKAAGLFVELPPEERHAERGGEIERPMATIEQIVRDSEGPNLDAIAFPATETILAPTVGGKIDFVAVYHGAALPPTPFTAEQAAEMLRSLPAELPLAMRRQTMNVALNAMGRSIGATPESIVADASRKLAALAAYAESLSGQTSQTITAADAAIAALEREIAAKREQIAQTQRHMAETLQACHEESDRIDDVLEFFSLDVPPSKHGVTETQERVRNAD